MGLEEQLKAAILNLHDHRFGREEAIKQYIIEPILRTLGWDISDQRRLVEREYRIGEGAVDYALLQGEQPLAFIEAKRIGSADGPKSRQQLFRYAADKGIPILVLTDGRLWEFYTGMGSGVWQERCFRRLTLDDDQYLSEYAEFFMAHLGRNAIFSGEAVASASSILSTKREMPDLWRTLLKEPDPQLHELLTNKVEKRCGVRPRADVVGAFLKERAAAALKEFSQGISSNPPPAPVSDAQSASASGSEPRIPVSEEASLHQTTSEPLEWIPQAEFALPILKVLVEEMAGPGRDPISSSQDRGGDGIAVSRGRQRKAGWRRDSLEEECPVWSGQAKEKGAVEAN